MDQTAVDEIHDISDDVLQSLGIRKQRKGIWRTSNGQTLHHPEELAYLVMGAIAAKFAAIETCCGPDMNMQVTLKTTDAAYVGTADTQFLATIRAYESAMADEFSVTTTPNVALTYHVYLRILRTRCLRATWIVERLLQQWELASIIVVREGWPWSCYYEIVFCLSADKIRFDQDLAAALNKANLADNEKKIICP